MKSYLIIMLVSLFGFGNLTSTTTENTKTIDQKEYRIAKIVSKGEFQINHKILQKKFQNGAPITEFKIMKFHDGFNLLRTGYGPNGGTRTEAIPLEISNGYVVLRHKVVWYTVCRSGECHFCQSNYQKNNCNCANGGGCVFGIDPIDPLEVVVLGPGL